MTQFPHIAASVLLALAAVPAWAEGPISEPTVYLGMCDASAAVALGDGLFAVANDEDNAIRVYHAEKGGGPVCSFEISRFLKVDPFKPETDLEGACWLGDRIFWMSSHGRNLTGKYRVSRHNFFATQWVKGKTGLQMLPVGQPYQNLLYDFIRDPRLRPFGLANASLLPPKARGALNIEGLCPTPDKHLLIGFRNPIPQGKALVVPLLNPDELLNGSRAKLGDPILLDLDGNGIRDMALCPDGQYLILAGSYNGEGQTKLYKWAGGQNAPEKVKGVKFKPYNPEAIVVYPDTKVFQVLSDDGTRLIEGVCCKELLDFSKKQFRSIWVDLSKATPGKKDKEDE